MANLRDLILPVWGSPRDVQRDSSISFQSWVEQFFYGNNRYAASALNTTWGSDRESIAATYAGFVGGAYKANAVVFACVAIRQRLLSEARFKFRELRNGRPGNLFAGNSGQLTILENPWPGGTTGDLITRMDLHDSLAGNSFTARQGDHLMQLRPDWVVIVMGKAAEQPDAEVLGYAYYPGGQGSGSEPVFYRAEQVAHYAPRPDPAARFRGMSWLTPIVREVEADGAATNHKLKFFENGATPNLVVKLDATVAKDAFEQWVDIMESNHTGVANAYKTLYLGGGADATVVGTNFEQMTFKEVQGAGETRIAAAAGIAPVVVGLSEGLANATYSNYGQARRSVADTFLRPTWRSMAAALANIVPKPQSGSELWYDDRDIPFLQADVKDEAETQQMQAAAIRQLVDAGFDPDSVTDAITAGDLSRLKHSGLPSVQVQPSKALPGGNGRAPEEAVPSGRA